MNTTQIKTIQCPYCVAFGEAKDFSAHMKLRHPNGGNN